MQSSNRTNDYLTETAKSTFFIWILIYGNILIIKNLGR